MPTTFLAARAIYDVPTAAIALVTFGGLWRFKISEPIVVLAAGEESRG